jgi:hypothetical protein
LGPQSELSEVENPVEARLAILFHPVSAREDLIALKAPKRVIVGVEDLLSRLGQLPNPAEPGELRIYRAALGARLQLQLACESALDESSAAAVSTALDALAVNRAGNSPLADGNWIAEQSGLTPGIRLGRLKAWLHHIQVESDLATLSEVAERLAQLSWQDGEPESWPRLQWPPADTPADE